MNDEQRVSEGTYFPRWNDAQVDYIINNCGVIESITRLEYDLAKDIKHYRRIIEERDKRIKELESKIIQLGRVSTDEEIQLYVDDVNCHYNDAKVAEIKCGKLKTKYNALRDAVKAFDEHEAPSDGDYPVNDFASKEYAEMLRLAGITDDAEQKVKSENNDKDKTDG